MMAIDDTGTDLWTVAGAWEELEVFEARFEAEFSTFFLMVEETLELWPEESCSGRNPGDLSRPRRADAVEAYAGPHGSQGLLITVSLWDAIY